MKLERSNVEFAIWRKKVDKSLFEHNGTTIPEWACRMWRLKEIYGGITSRKAKDSVATVSFQGSRFSAWVTTAPHGRSSPAFRLWYDPALSAELKMAFVMSYMRSLEGSLGEEVDAETKIPFWEFLDIEFDANTKMFRFVAYYTVEPQFPNLFRRLIGSPAVRRIEDEIAQKGEARIHKQDWRPRSEFRLELGARNVLYTLLDSNAKMLYIGEAADLVKRLSQPHASVPNWDFYRYNVLPGALEPYRVAIERMLIRDLAALLENKRGIAWRDITGCVLTNDRIDR